MSNEKQSEQLDWTKGFPVVAGHINLGLTEASPESGEYWAGVMRGELLLKQCSNCARHLHPRRMGCPDCYKAKLNWVKASGKGTVYTFSTVHRSPAPEFDKSVPYCVGIVELSESVYLFTRFFTADRSEPAIGVPVELDFRILENGQRLPVFLCQGES